MIKRIGKCSFGFPDKTYTEEFEFPDNSTEEEMEKELAEWANQFIVMWFEDIKELRREEPKHGKWLDYLEEGLKWKCSECGSKFTKPWNYCPNCGAIMESEE